jgi:REP element-mobilizing transposase RayT
MLSKKITLMDLVQNIKANSSKWMKTKHPSLSKFNWQGGYGAFSVNPADLERLVLYIKNQHEHHGKKTFQNEYRKILTEHEMDFDERYLWD